MPVKPNTTSTVRWANCNKSIVSLQMYSYKTQTAQNVSTKSDIYQVVKSLKCVHSYNVAMSAGPTDWRRFHIHTHTYTVKVLCSLSITGNFSHCEGRTTAPQYCGTKPTAVEGVHQNKTEHWSFTFIHPNNKTIVPKHAPHNLLIWFAYYPVILDTKLPFIWTSTYQAHYYYNLLHHLPLPSNKSVTRF